MRSAYSLLVPLAAAAISGAGLAFGGLVLAPAASADCTSYSGSAQCSSDNSRGSTSRGSSGGGHTYCDDPYDFDWDYDGDCDEYGIDVDLGYDNRTPPPPQINNGLPNRPGIGGGRPGGGRGR